MSYEEQRRELILWCRRIYDRGLVFASDGNFSMRLPDGNILITPSKRNKGFLQPEELLVVTPDGRALEGGTPSSEFPMHRAIYETCPKAQVVLHSHPPFSTAYASAGRPVPENYFVEAPLFLGQVPVTEFAVPGTPDMVRIIEPYFNSTSNLLLKNHGALVWDKSLEAAYNRLEVLEAVCRMAYYTDALGGADAITPEQLEQLRAAKQKKERT